MVEGWREGVVGVGGGNGGGMVWDDRGTRKVHTAELFVGRPRPPNIPPCNWEIEVEVMDFYLLSEITLGFRPALTGGGGVFPKIEV